MKLTLNTPYEFIKSHKQLLSIVNPRFKNPTNGKYVDLPRFSSPEMQQARSMNVISKMDLYKEFSNKIPPKAIDKDIDRLILTDYDSSHNRAVWVSPKTKTPYYLLKEDESKRGIDIRVLNKDGEFLKNITTQPKRVILGDLIEGDNCITEIFGMDFCHSDFMDIVARRYNPFAKYEIVKLKDDYELLELANKIKPDTSCVELSYVIEANAPLNKKGKDIEKEFIQTLCEIAPEERKYLNGLKSLSSKTRVLMSSGNDGGNKLNTLLLKTGFEGVGGLNKLGMVDNLSGSRSSYFTQHYEPFCYDIITTKEGINLSGLRGTDVEIYHEKPVGRFLYTLRGTSFSAPVRASKIALNDMVSTMIEI